jgi:hypothetical protein
MPRSPNNTEIFFEVGEKRVFAGALHWPAWCRSGRDEALAVQSLLDYGPRYAQILQSTGLGFEAPGAASQFQIVERVDGNATTDFGAPDASLSSDKEPVEPDELERFQAILQSCWVAFDQAVKRAEGRQLKKGPRGGGRDLEGIIDHVLMADESYLKRIGWKAVDAEEDVDKRLHQIRSEILDGLEASARGELPARGPRGGKRWTARFFVRRVAWHVVDHAWEIEDRVN